MTIKTEQQLKAEWGLERYRNVLIGLTYYIHFLSVLPSDIDDFQAMAARNEDFLELYSARILETPNPAWFGAANWRLRPG